MVRIHTVLVPTTSVLKVLLACRIAEALLAPNTTLEEVLFGMFTWLHKHPSETVLVSVNTESGPGRVNDARLQEKLFNIFTDPRASRFWLQNIGEVSFVFPPDYAFLVEFWN